MDDSETVTRLEHLREQRYPLMISEEDAQVIAHYIGIIMDLVSDDDAVLVRGHYNLVTSAICHPNINTFDQDEG